MILTIKEVVKKVYGNKSRLGERGTRNTNIHKNRHISLHDTPQPDTRKPNKRTGEEPSPNKKARAFVGVKTRTINEWCRKLG